MVGQVVAFRYERQAFDAQFLFMRVEFLDVIARFVAHKLIERTRCAGSVARPVLEG